MKKISLPVGVITAVMATTLLMPTMTHAAPTPPPSPVDEGSQVFNESVAVMPEEGSTPNGEVGTQAICTAWAIVDYPHISTSNPGSPRATQAHGGWNKGNCNATHADVTTQIDRKNPIGLFQAVGAQGKGRLPSEPSMGLPSSNRVTARYECNGLAGAPFRAWTSMDMVGIVDTQTPKYSPATENISCG